VTAVLLVLVVIAVAVIGAVAYLAVQRRRPPRREDGVASFQRHLDALSPEARRQVIDRVKKGER
jgi:hypothetical protein